MLAQRTLKSLTRAVGVGLHGGQRVELVLRPAPPDHGIVFRRVDLPVPVDIKVDPFAITDTRLNTTLSARGDPGAPKVRTIEHLLSACAGLGLDNLVIDMIDVNLSEYKDSEEARVRFYPNGTADELTVIAHSIRGEYFKMSLEATTGLPSWERDPSKFK